MSTATLSWAMAQTQLTLKMMREMEPMPGLEEVVFVRYLPRCNAPCKTGEQCRCVGSRNIEVEHWIGKRRVLKWHRACWRHSAPHEKKAPVIQITRGKKK